MRVSKWIFPFSVMDSHRSGMRVRTRCERSLSSLINIIRMQLLLVGATRLNDLLFFFFASIFLFILYCIYIYPHSVDNWWWLRMIARCSGFNRRERETMPCVCVWGRCYHHYSARRENKGNLSHFLLYPLFFLHRSIVYGLWMHERMYTINKILCMFPRYMCA
jgi:hypothetical protein